MGEGGAVGTVDCSRNFGLYILLFCTVLLCLVTVVVELGGRYAMSGDHPRPFQVLLSVDSYGTEKYKEH